MVSLNMQFKDQNKPYNEFYICFKTIKAIIVYFL